MSRTLAILLIAFAAGCTSAANNDAQAALSKSDYQALRQEFSEPTGGGVQQNRNYPVAQGTPPLAYIVVGHSTVYVFDATSGVVIASAQAPSQSVVSIDAEQGVTVGGSVVAPGPLPSAHSYSIFVEPDLNSREGTTK